MSKNGELVQPADVHRGVAYQLRQIMQGHGPHYVAEMYGIPLDPRQTKGPLWDTPRLAPAKAGLLEKTFGQDEYEGLRDVREPELESDATDIHRMLAELGSTALDVEWLTFSDAYSQIHSAA